MFKIITLNLNGIRAASKKGVLEWFLSTNADVICVQETKAQVAVLGAEHFAVAGYHSYFVDAQRPGYSGVGIYCKQQPDELVQGFGEPSFDAEGRYIGARFGDLWVSSIYVHSGSSAPARQAEKFRFMDFYLPILRQMAGDQNRHILCGDWNIAHKNEDLRNFKGNQKNSGFLPEERAWLDTLFDEVGFIDAFRQLKQPEHSYTWWSNRGQAYAKNVGWRIDYQILSPNLKGSVKSANIYKNQRFSDHAPLICEYDF